MAKFLITAFKFSKIACRQQCWESSFIYSHISYSYLKNSSKYLRFEHDRKCIVIFYLFSSKSNPSIPKSYLRYFMKLILILWIYNFIKMLYYSISWNLLKFEFKSFDWIAYPNFQPTTKHFLIRKRRF